MPRRLSFAALFLAAAPAFAQLSPDAALKSMKPGDGLKVELFAAEPMVINPTSMDVDHKGRVWIAEAVNYRRKNFNRPIVRPEGDRIQILIDETGDGKATKAVTFYQGSDLYGPLSVLVLPQADLKSLRVLVAQSPDILEFWDRDGDLKADGPPTKFLTGFGGFDHDHGVHGLTTGPDGKLYFTVGDSGVKGLKAKDGKGKEYTSNNTDVQKGTVWRCDLDGTNLELIAHNFRNNYEACVDSFGEIWLSDNDDDGNQQTRICFVMPGGNYGYGPRGPGQTHWHEEQPGIVHKTLRTGFGSPTGICFYEGNLLKKFTGDLLHCDAGPREVRAFHRKPMGAGYELDKTVILTSSDTWFRPSDVTVAPDGSVFVCDWYDPGVGGHGMGDTTRGRVYRVTPAGHRGYPVPEARNNGVDSVLGALGSPNIAERTLAWAMLYAMSPAEMQVAQLTAFSRKNLALAARGFALQREMTAADVDAVAKIIPADVAEKLGQPILKFYDDPKYQAFLLRTLPHSYIQRHRANEIIDLQFRVWSDRGTGAILREAVLSLYAIRSDDDRNTLFYKLARLYDGQDIFYRAALNIACGTDPARRDAILADFEKHFPDWNDKVADLVWELRPKSMLPKLGTLLTDAKLTAAQKARIVDILAASDDPAAGKTVLGLLTADQSPEVKARALESLKLFLPTKWKGLAESPELKAAADGLFADRKTLPVALQLVAAAKYYPALPKVGEIAEFDTYPLEVRKQAVQTLGDLPSMESAGKLGALITYNTSELAPSAVKALAAQIGNNGATDHAKLALAVLGTAVINPKSAPVLKTEAVSALAGTRAGTGLLIRMKEKGELPVDVIAHAGRLLRNSPFQGERNKALQLFLTPAKLDLKKLPSPAELAKQAGNPERGKQIFAESLKGETQCLKCHVVQGVGGQIGPDLSLIGKKGSKENLFESILNPSKAVADQYVQWRLETEDGQTITGLIVQETETTVTVRDANGKDYQFPAKGTGRKKQLQSIMPEGLVTTLTEDDLIDVVAYMMTLTTPAMTPATWQVLGPLPAGDGLDASHPALAGGAGKYTGKSGQALSWEPFKANAEGYLDLAARGGADAPNSQSFLKVVIESPADQDAELLLGTDDGCRVFVNGTKVFGHDRAEAAAPARDRVPVKLKAGPNTVMLRVGNGNNPHGVYCSILSALELKLK